MKSRGGRRGEREGSVNTTGRDVGRWRRRVYGWSWPRTYERAKETDWACERAKRNGTVQEPGNDASLAYAWQRRKRLHGRQAIHQHTSVRRTADQRRKESRFTELKEIERSGARGREKGGRRGRGRGGGGGGGGKYTRDWEIYRVLNRLQSFPLISWDFRKTFDIF